VPGAAVVVDTADVVGPDGVEPGVAAGPLGLVVVTGDALDPPTVVVGPADVDVEDEVPTVAAGPPAVGAAEVVVDVSAAATVLE
jgi:hypothetical protein